MSTPALYIRLPRNHSSWQGPPAQTWTVVQRAASALLDRWRPAALGLTRTRFDDHDQPEGPRSFDRLDVRPAGVGLDALVDVSEVLAADPIEARVAVPATYADATTLWFVDPDQRERQARLTVAPDIGAWRTRWFSADCPLLRGFVLYIPERGHIEAHWDRGIFAGVPEPSDWQHLDREFDDRLAAQLRDLGFTDR